MNTITLWLLVSIGNGGVGNNASTTALVERFAVADECMRVREILVSQRKTLIFAGKPDLYCIEAKVYKP